MINKINQVLNNNRKHTGGKDMFSRRHGTKHSVRHPVPDEMIPESSSEKERGSGMWIPFASYCTTGQFMKLQDGYKRHCGPTAAVNIVRTLQNSEEFGTKRNGPQKSSKDSGTKRNDPQKSSKDSGIKRNKLQKNSEDCGTKRNDPRKSGEELFLLFAEIGKHTHIYWNMELLGHFGGTSNFLTGIFLRSCLGAAGLDKKVSVRFHPWITPDAVKKALDQGSIVLLQVYHHPKYKNHHMLCYAYETDPDSGRERFLLADGWANGPVWIDASGIGYGHFLTIREKT